VRRKLILEIAGEETSPDLAQGEAENAEIPVAN
jgi:hypothetical protein